MVIFNRYVKLPEGMANDCASHLFSYGLLCFVDVSRFRLKTKNLRVCHVTWPWKS